MEQRVPYTTSGTGGMVQCSYCGNWHTGVCPKIKAIEYNSEGGVKKVWFHAPSPPMAGLEAIKDCAICGNPTLFAAVLPFGSRYDGEVICGGCAAKLIDPAIDERNEQGKPQKASDERQLQGF